VGMAPLGLVAVRKPDEPGKPGAVPFKVGYGAPPVGTWGTGVLVGSSGETVVVSSSLGTSSGTAGVSVPVEDSPPAVCDC